MSKLVNWTISLSGGQKLFALFETISNLGADHLTLEGGRGSLRTADVFPVVDSLPPKNNFSEGEKRRPEISLLFAG